jgi:hypothetical protein
MIAASVEDQQDARPEATYPSVSLAYEWVLPSYQMAVQRWDSIDSRIQSIITFGSTVTVAVPTFLRAIAGASVDFHSIWFALAMLMFGIYVILGLATRAFGYLRLLGPQRLHDRLLHLDQSEFQRTVLYWAGVHFVRNIDRVKRKGHVLTAMTWLFVLEAGFLIWWSISQIRAAPPEIAV